MNIKEKLQRIRARCVELVLKYPPCESVSAYRSTIAAIDGLLPALSRMQKRAGHRLMQVAQPFREELNFLRVSANAIIAAWPEELL